MGTVHFPLNAPISVISPNADHQRT